MNIDIHPFLLEEKYRPEIETLFFQLSGKQRVVHLNNHPEAYCMGAFDAERLVGFAQVFLIRKCAFTYGLLEDVIVHENYRGQSIGKMLVLEIIRLAEEKGAEHINLTVRPDRAEARKLYQSLGFIQQETDVFRLKLDTQV